MVYSKITVLTALMAMALGAPVISKDTSGVVKVPLQKAKYTGAPNRHLSRRGTPQEPLDFTGTRYFAEYTIGGQNLSGILDTGSSDAWTFSSEAWSGGYDPSKSSTYRWENNDYHEIYGSNKLSVYGTWGTDTVGIGNVVVPDFPIAFLNQSIPEFPDNRGLLGIGPKSLEAVDNKYPTFAERLKDAGVIQSNSFSLFTDSDDEATLLFGGIDTTKYNGPLYTLPFDRTEAYGNRYYGVNFEVEGTTYSGGILDSGTPNILFPKNLTDSLAASYGASWYDYYASYASLIAPDTSAPGLNITIGGINITVPVSDLFRYYDGAYIFEISYDIVEEGGIDINILGDPVLRQLYLFFDNDRDLVAFAPIAESQESNLLAVSDSIPGSVPAPDQTEGGGVGSGSTW